MNIVTVYGIAFLAFAVGSLFFFVSAVRFPRTACTWLGITGSVAGIAWLFPGIFQPTTENGALGWMIGEYVGAFLIWFALIWAGEPPPRGGRKKLPTFRSAAMLLCPSC